MKKGELKVAFKPEASLVLIAEALGRIARALEGCKVDDSQEPDSNVCIFSEMRKMRCGDCGEFFHFEVLFAPVPIAVACPFCRSGNLLVCKMGS